MSGSPEDLEWRAYRSRRMKHEAKKAEKAALRREREEREEAEREATETTEAVGHDKGEHSRSSHEERPKGELRHLMPHFDFISC